MLLFNFAVININKNWWDFVQVSRDNQPRSTRMIVNNARYKLEAGSRKLCKYIHTSQKIPKLKTLLLTQGHIYRCQ
jgi:hypothetical protein